MNHAYLGLCFEYAYQFHVSDVVNYFIVLLDVNISISYIDPSTSS